jgi:hypothetical protein
MIIPKALIAKIAFYDEKQMKCVDLLVCISKRKYVSLQSIINKEPK